MPCSKGGIFCYGEGSKPPSLRGASLAATFHILATIYTLWKR